MEPKTDLHNLLNASLETHTVAHTHTLSQTRVSDLTDHVTHRLKQMCASINKSDASTVE